MSIVAKNQAVKWNLFAATFTFLFMLSTGCAKPGSFVSANFQNSNQGQEDFMSPQDSQGVPSDAQGSDSWGASTPPPVYKMQPLSWETKTKPERTDWSLFLQKIILNEWSSLLPGANDITQFCPRYPQLDNNERANVWAQIFVSIARFESGYSPVSRMHETTMGTDPVTGQPVYSEGLLQLSYQDQNWAPWCDFDWQKDRHLSSTDSQRTILSPYRNLDCGVGIMAKQIKTKGSIVLSAGVYWAVIKAGGRYQRIAEIQGMVRSLPLCK